MDKNYTFELIKGLKEHAAQAEALYALRQATGHDGNASSDPVWFATNSVDSCRRPWTVLMLRGGQPVGAVLLREQMRFGLPLGYFFACNAAGDEFVLAPKGQTEETLRRCMEAFTARRPAAVVFLATREDYGKAGWKSLKYGASAGTAPYRLPLLTTVDATMQQFGAHTRRNLRYYARQVSKCGATFHPELTAAETRQAAAWLRPACDYPVPVRSFNAIQAAVERLPGGFSCGLKSADGEWLSLLTGWRDGSKTSVFFQMNHGAHRKASLSTAMRALLIEEEVRRGGSDLIFVSYSSATIERGCASDPRYDLLLARPSWRLWLMARFANRLPVSARLRECLQQSRPISPQGRPKLGDLRAGW